MFGEWSRGPRTVLSALLAAALLLTAVAWLRGAEYDEQYTLFLTGAVARPIWPAGVDHRGRSARQLQAGHAGFVAIARDLRGTDVHPPLYFWAVAGWRRLAGDSLFAARMASVLFSIVTLSLVAAIARSGGIPVVPAVLLTVGCYGFAYTGAIARGFALAQMLSVAGIAVLLGAERRASRMLAAGMLLGAATFAHYLAVFTACAALLHTVLLSLRGARRQPGAHARNSHRGAQRDEDCFASLAMTGPLLAGFALWVPADLWFFLAQRQSRTDQFAPFEVVSAVARLAQYSAATLFGGLPLYVARHSAHGRHRGVGVPPWHPDRAGRPTLAPHRHTRNTPVVRHGRGRAAARPAAARLRVRQRADRTALSRLRHAVHRPAAGRCPASAYPPHRSGHSGHRAGAA